MQRSADPRFALGGLRIYHLYGSPAEAFRDPAIDAIFDGDHPEDQIFPRLPARVLADFATS